MPDSCPGFSAARPLRMPMFPDAGRGALLIRDRHKKEKDFSLAIPGLQRTTTRRRGASCCAAPGTRDVTTLIPGTNPFPAARAGDSQLASARSDNWRGAGVSPLWFVSEVG